MDGGSGDDGIGLLSGAPVPPPKAAPAAEAVARAPSPTAAPAPPPKTDVAHLLTLQAADDTVREVTAGTVTTLSAVLTSRAPGPVDVALSVEIGFTSTYPGEGAEWPVMWTPPGKRTRAELFPRKENHSIHVAPNAGVALSFEITAPVGVRYGDRVEVRLAVEPPDGGSARRRRA